MAYLDKGLLTPSCYSIHCPLGGAVGCGLLMPSCYSIHCPLGGAVGWQDTGDGLWGGEWGEGEKGI